MQDFPGVILVLVSSEIEMPACRATFTNRLPDFWQATIVAIGAKFFYKRADGSISHDWQTSKAVNLGSNQSDQLDSNEPQSCVGAGFFAVTVRIPGQPDTIATKSDGSNPNECATEYAISITPRPSEFGVGPSIEEVLNTKSVEVTIFSKKAK